MQPVGISQACLLIFLGVLFMMQGFMEATESGNRVSRRRNRNRGEARRGGLAPDLQQALENAHGVTTSSTPVPIPDAWRANTPALPGPDELDCLIEIPATMGGRCVRLGGRNNAYGCQRGVNLRLADECQEIIEAREAIKKK